MFWTSPCAKRVLFRLLPLGYPISLLLHTDVSATIQAHTFTGPKPSLCCRAPVLSLCVLLSRHHQQSLAIDYLHALMLLLADAPLAIPETFSVLCSCSKAVKFPHGQHWHLLSSSLSGVSWDLVYYKTGLKKEENFTFTASVWDKWNISKFSCGWRISILSCQYFFFFVT